MELLSLYAWYGLLEDPGRSPPSSLQQLYAGAAKLSIERIDERTLELCAEPGWGTLPVERVFGAVADMPRPGSELSLASMQVLVRESDREGHPTRVQFRFPTALESPDRLWLVWQGKKPAPWQPPRIGEHVVLAPLGVFSALDP